MHIKTVALSLGFILAAGVLHAASPQMGTWKLNESKSKLTPHTTKNTTVVYSSGIMTMGKVKVTTDGTGPNGKPVHAEWMGQFDGKDYSVTGDPTSDTRAYTAVNERTLQMSVKKNGKAVANGRVVVSADGKSRTVTLNGTTPKGKKFKNIAVYDKQ